MKNYYAIFGLLPSADAVAIRAVYKALIQLHHPDKPENNNKESEEFIKALNEAYETLSNVEARRIYDEQLKKDNLNASDYFADEKITKDDPLEEAWLKAQEYYPDLKSILDTLNNISWGLGYSFKATILESKNFQNRHKLSINVKNEFLKVYYGSDPEILKFAEYLATHNHKEAAKDLNKTINILGSSTSPDKIISKIKSKYGIKEEKDKLQSFEKFQMTILVSCLVVVIALTLLVVFRLDSQ